MIRHTDIGNNDVLLGRGTGPNGSQGNIRYRTLVRQVLEKTCGISDSVNTERGNGWPPLDEVHGAVEKSDLASQIVQVIKSRGGRFLQKVEDPGSDNEHSKPNQDRYFEVDDAVAQKKTKQTFRHQMRIIERNHFYPTTGSQPPRKRVRTHSDCCNSTKAASISPDEESSLHHQLSSGAKCQPGQTSSLLARNESPASLFPDFQVSSRSIDSIPVMGVASPIVPSQAVLRFPLDTANIDITQFSQSFDSVKLPIPISLQHSLYLQFELEKERQIREEALFLAIAASHSAVRP